jgi:hypothetical protein
MNLFYQKVKDYDDGSAVYELTGTTITCLETGDNFKIEIISKEDIIDEN